MFCVLRGKYTTSGFRRLACTFTPANLSTHEDAVVTLDKLHAHPTPLDVTKQRPAGWMSPTAHENMENDLSALSHADLLARCTRLEQQLKAQTAQIAELTRTTNEANRRSPSPSTTSRKPTKEFDASRHSTRFIALKSSYLGHKYNGFEHANRCFTPLPTIEEVLWKALRKTRLISPPIPEGADTSYEVIYDPKEREKTYYIHGKSRPADAQRKKRLEISWEGCQYSKCGRTDRGVSAFGQVIGIRVRSNAPVKKEMPQFGAGENLQTDIITPPDAEVDADAYADAQKEQEPHPPFDPIRDELPYVYMLNMILPPDIRILAWCPDPPDGFDARYSCQERRYKYFFTNPAFCPTPGPMGQVYADGSEAAVREGWLDIEKMKEAAKKLEGLHDYRNLCQIDASKQMPSCERRIAHADIEEVESAPVDFCTNPGLNASGETVSPVENGQLYEAGPKVYAIVIHGSAFLWHQVRCTAAVLFLVGQGLESPEIIDKLLDIKQTPGRPHYAMADDAPLVLWDCVFPSENEHGDGGLKWIYAGDEATIPALTSKGDGKFGLGGVVDELWTQWQETKLKEAQIGGLLSLAMAQGDVSSVQRGGFRDPTSVKARSQKVFEGSGQARLVGNYQPLMTRRVMDSLETMNAKYLKTVKGARRLALKEAWEAQAQD
ncbi:pseudouridine synthase deg1 [Knufia obscura]|uniref:Pseudouridine synthase deg1 n=2 Tax=Knufia TaxID=430999 RepID=A0AAN8ER02_9EURO|nr:pseudouridine synthase deg1 [Knufia obscura]KAK5954105.1 pseudouridine synthase deg1 [Knufia fluminis]